MYTIFCDSLQEGLWFKNLNYHFNNAEIQTIPSQLPIQQQYGIQEVLVYDRPDIILKDNRTGAIIFVLERTKEVPSGHNVGQRFGRLAAAAERRIPVVYFGPFVAFKHGGNTAGPRYMNLRLFYSLRRLAQRYNTAVTTINWPVDNNYEVLTTPEKDQELRDYLVSFFSYYDNNGFNGLTEFIADSAFQQNQIQAQDFFARNIIQNPEQYNSPPESVSIMNKTMFEQNYGAFPAGYNTIHNIYVYNVGMNYVRSDPYAGMTCLYYYLYCAGVQNTCLVLLFPNISYQMWRMLRPTSKTYKMFKLFSAGIIFCDGLKWRQDL